MVMKVHIEETRLVLDNPELGKMWRLRFKEKTYWFNGYIRTAPWKAKCKSLPKTLRVLEEVMRNSPEFIKELKNYSDRVIDVDPFYETVLTTDSVGKQTRYYLKPDGKVDIGRYP